MLDFYDQAVGPHRRDGESLLQMKEYFSRRNSAEKFKILPKIGAVELPHQEIS